MNEEHRKENHMNIHRLFDVSDDEFGILPRESNRGIQIEKQSSPVLVPRREGSTLKAISKKIM